MTILNIEGLDKSYGAIHAVDNLNLEVQKGQIFGILGPNGSGKTTTLAMILGIVHMDKGSYSWFDEKPSPAQHTKIGSLLESPNFYPYLNLIENLRIVCKIKGIPEAEIFRVLKIVGLLERQKSKFQTMSYGMKQRLALASVLMGDPDVLVLDEPANGLDPEGIAEVREIVKGEAMKGKTILMASHILDEVEKVCSHVAILRKGKLLKYGEVGSLLRTETLMILSAEDMDSLKDQLEGNPAIASYELKGNDIHAVLKDGHSAGDLNKGLVSKGLALTKMEVHKQSLEEQFLELLKQANQEGGMS